MRGVKGTFLKLINGVTDADANIFAAAQGSSERSISLLVGSEKCDTVVRSVHAKFIQNMS